MHPLVNYQDAMADNQPYLFHARIAAGDEHRIAGSAAGIVLDVQAAWQRPDIPLNAPKGFYPADLVGASMCAASTG